MGKDNLITATGTVEKILKGGKFTVKIGNQLVECYPNRLVRKRYMSVVVGDTVTVEVDKTDLTKGRIVSVKKN